MRHAGLEGVYRRRRRGCTTPQSGRGPGRRSGQPSLHRRRTGPTVGHLTSPNIRPAAAGSISRWSSTRGRAGWSAGRSRIICAPSSSSTRSRWRSGVAAPTGQWSTPITAPNTRPGRSAGDYVRPGCSARWAPSATRTTTPSPRAFFGTLQLELLDRHRWTDTPAARVGDLRMDRVLLQPPTPSLVCGDAQPRRLRDQPRGMINTTNPSGKPGQPQVGLEGADEVWFPVDPRTVLVLTWESPVGEEIVRLPRSQARAINQNTLDHAFEFVFRHPKQHHLAGLSYRPSPRPVLHVDGATRGETTDGVNRPPTRVRPHRRKRNK